MADQFKDADDDTKAYFPANQEVVGLLEQMTAIELALAVPYVKIWQIEPGTGKAVHVAEDGSTPKAPLSLKLIEPPRFGAQADTRFRERPPVSLERLSVKTNSYRGAFSSREVELVFTVHRPDVVFGETNPDTDNWSTLITPGLMHVVEYGWQSSGQHPLLNGNGYHSTQGSKQVVVPAKKRLAFTNYDYSFGVTDDMQFKITVRAVENGDLHLRTAPLAGLLMPQDEKNSQNRDRANQTSLANPAIAGDKAAKDLIEKLQGMLKQVKREKSDHSEMVKFRDFADEFFSQSFGDALRQMGFKTINLYMGKFNRRAGKTIKRFGGKDMSSSSIGDFVVPIDWIHERFAEIIKNGSIISVTNFTTAFLRVLGDQANWDRTGATVDRYGIENQTIPDVRVKVVVSGDEANVFITDIKAESTRFTETDRERGGENLTIEQIKDKCKQRDVPYVRLLKANSFILGAEFDVTNDEQMKAILIKRYNAPTREELVSQPTAVRKAGSPSPSQLIYSSAIVGAITMIGNFAFDTFAMMWIDFDVKNWSGPFWVLEHEDLIERAKFVTKIQLMATGEDPLNSQGRVPPSVDQPVATGTKQKTRAGKTKQAPR